MLKMIFFPPRFSYLFARMFLCVFSWSYYGIENLEWQKSTPQYPSPPDTITLFQNEPQTQWSSTCLPALRPDCDWWRPEWSRPIRAVHLNQWYSCQYSAASVNWEIFG